MPLPDVIPAPTVTITWPDVLGLAPELQVLTNTQAQFCMNTVQDDVIVASWVTQERANRAALLYAAHLGTGIRLGMWGQPLNDVSVGQVKKTFKQRADMAWPLEQSRYGMQYLMMCRQYLPRFSLGA